MWDFLSEKSKKFVETLGSGSLSLEQDSTSKDRDLFSSFLDQRSESIGDFEGVISKIKEIYKEEPNIELEKFANLFFERVKNDPEPTGDYYTSEPDDDYSSSSIIDYLYSEFDHFYVSISGSRSDRWNSLSLRPKWHYEYLLCALKYCVESGKAQKELNMIKAWARSYFVPARKSRHLVKSQEIMADLQEVLMIHQY